MKHRLSEKWIKASIAGTIWAASEIVFGSFMHNLRIPFSGNILTAIGIIILISISYLWTDRGLFWRAGLICAIMKTMSPSAVILGPMIAIFAESLLLEGSVRLLGRTIPGYLLGSMLAMSWNLFQRISTYIIYYGANIIGIYTNLLKMAQKQLNLRTDIVWLPILFLLFFYAIFGLVAGLIGIRTGRKMLNRQPGEIDSESEKKISQTARSSGDFDYSVPWLFINFFLILGSLVLLNYSSWFIWSSIIICIIAVWSVRYKRALRQLGRPRFWIFFVIITLITAFVFTNTANGENLIVNGLLTGFQMNFRAVVIIVGFSTLGTELFNPRVRNFFMRTSFRNLPLALELSAESLPSFIAMLPDFREFRKRPSSLFSRVIFQADRKMKDLTSGSRVFIVTGPRSGGKTTFIKMICAGLKSSGIKPVGFISERIMSGTVTTGYNITDISTDETVNFLLPDDGSGNETIGKFRINPEGLQGGRSILHSLLAERNRIIFVDEAGRLELSGGGWATEIDLLRATNNIIVLAVRDEFVEEVKVKWHLTDPVIFDIMQIKPEYAASQLIKSLYE